MSRSSSERISEEDKLREEFIKMGLEIFFDRWLLKMEAYADQKINQVFEEENNRGKGMIRVRTDKGVMMLTPEEFEQKGLVIKAKKLQKTVTGSYWN